MKRNKKILTILLASALMLSLLTPVPFAATAGSANLSDSADLSGSADLADGGEDGNGTGATADTLTNNTDVPGCSDTGNGGSDDSYTDTNDSGTDGESGTGNSTGGESGTGNSTSGESGTGNSTGGDNGTDLDSDYGIMPMIDSSIETVSDGIDFGNMPGGGFIDISPMTTTVGGNEYLVVTSGGGTVNYNNGTFGGSATGLWGPLKPYLTQSGGFTLTATPSTGYTFSGWQIELPSGWTRETTVSGVYSYKGPSDETIQFVINGNQLIYQSGSDNVLDLPGLYFRAVFIPDSGGVIFVGGDTRISGSSEKESPGMWVRKSNGLWHFLNPDGSTATGWIEWKGKTYFLNDDGSMMTGWVESDGNYYFFNDDGSMATGWIESDGKYYFFNDDGSMATGWIESDGKYYFFNGDGSMMTGRIEWNGKQYFLNDDGSMATGWVWLNDKEGYYFNDDGSMATGWVYIDGIGYCFNDDGSLSVNWVERDGKRYFVHEDFTYATGWLEWNGKKYYFNDDGSMATGWVELFNNHLGFKLNNSLWYYFDDSDGYMYTGNAGVSSYYTDTGDVSSYLTEIEINGKMYLISPDGMVVNKDGTPVSW